MRNRVLAGAVILAAPLIVGAAATVPTSPAPIAAGSPAATNAPPRKPAYDDATCTGCHASLTGKKVTHGLFKTGSGCAECHLPADGAGKCRGLSPAWKLTAHDPVLCATCHDVQGAARPHPVIEAVGCTACHDPHASDLPSLLKDVSPSLCAGCHGARDDKKEVHPAVADCLNCHDPHAGAAEPLLKKPRNQVCFECHEAKDLFQKRFHHAPVAEGRCADCHDPHSSDLPKHLRAQGKALCLRCHDAKAPAGVDCGRGKCVDLSRPTVHPALEIADCQDCHAPGHSAANRKMLDKTPPELCYGCHDRKDQARFTHGAVKLGDCAVCHDPHSAEHPKLLRQEPDKGLCFRCHTDDVTGRAFVHVPVATGDCTLCHDPHGAPNPFNLSAGEGKKVCYSCHAEKDAGVKVRHGAIERYGCTACHDPHGAANQFQLVKPINQLCQTCHTDKKDGTHVTTFVAGGHKIAGGPDPHDVQRDFSCVSCHEPHGTNSPRLLRYGNSAFEFCDWCHGDRSGKHPELKDITRRKRPKPAAVGTPGAPAPGDAPGLPRDAPAPANVAPAAPIPTTTP